MLSQFSRVISSSLRSISISFRCALVTCSRLVAEISPTRVSSSNFSAFKENTVDSSSFFFCAKTARSFSYDCWLRSAAFTLMSKFVCFRSNSFMPRMSSFRSRLSFAISFLTSLNSEDNFASISPSSTHETFFLVASRALSFISEMRCPKISLSFCISSILHRSSASSDSIFSMLACNPFLFVSNNEISLWTRSSFNSSVFDAFSFSFFVLFSSSTRNSNAHSNSFFCFSKRDICP